ncbi:hypothetical protein BSKO_11486 [Bryopsis sp. KO-2023]|nr:hypothetical protein BSKO_11486 [Bryopsis sp. KO-2023]
MSSGMACSRHFARTPHIQATRPPRSLPCRCFKHKDHGLTPQGIILPPLDVDHASVRLFGVDHLTVQSSIGNHILEEKPGAVVVETAVTPTHGGANGRVFSCADDEEEEGLFMRQMICATVRELQKLDAVIGSDLWKNLEVNMNGEQLAYVSALGVGADLIFGDRPKIDTLLRLAKLATITDLDYAYGEQSKSNYLDLALGGHIRERKTSLDDVGRVEAIMLLEREALMCQAIHQACQDVGSGGSVVGVVGAEHVKAMTELWTSNTFGSIVAAIEKESMEQEPVEGFQDVDEPMKENPGIRRALLESFLRLAAGEQLITVLNENLEPISDEYRDDYWFASELYGSTRMLLAVMDKESLSKVCCGWQCDMWDILEGYRKVRPINGGTGVDLELIVQQRALDPEVTG